MNRQRLFGLDFITDTSIEELADELVSQSPTGTTWRSVVTPNVDHLVRYDKHPREFAVAMRSTWVLPDGIPVVWSSRLLRHPLHERLAGSDLFNAMWQRIIVEGRSIVLLVANDDTARRLVAEYSDAHCLVPPMFSTDDDAAVQAVVDQLAGQIDAHHPEFVMLGVSMPKHHLLCERMFELPTTAHPVPIILLLGASAELHVGLQTRAPRWMQRSGLEWLHRLLSDPKRMARRYLIDDMAFIRIVVRAVRSQS